MPQQQYQNQQYGNKPNQHVRKLSLYETGGSHDQHVESVYDPVTSKARFCVYSKSLKKVSYAQQIKWIDGETYVPQDGGASGLLENKTILLPSEASPYNSEEELLDEIQGFIRTYMIMPDEFYNLASHYVLLTWLGDCFPSVPYLRARGDIGVGKSRWLKTIGSLCYTPVFASGATTASPIFRIYEIYRRATFIFDEADWDNQNDEFGEVMKVLNIGYEKGASVLRSSVEGHAVEPRAYDVFGPKLLATRNVFKDSALESRCFTIALKVYDDMGTIPDNIGLSFWQQAQHIRNQLLMWRFHHFKVHHDIPSLDVPGVHPRLRMIMTPMIMCRSGEESKKELIGYLKGLNIDIQERRSMDLEASILEALLACFDEQGGLGLDTDMNVPIREIMEKMNSTRESDGEEKIGARKIHTTLKTRLNIEVKRRGKGFSVSESHKYVLMVAAQFGVAGAPSVQEPGANDTYLQAPPEPE